MADILVHVLVQNLRELMKSKHPIISRKQYQPNLGYLYNNFHLMSNFLEKTEAKSFLVDDEKVVNDLITKIREVVREAENFLDSFVMKSVLVDRGYGASSYQCLSWKSLKEQLDSVMIEVDQMNAKFDQQLRGKNKMKKQIGKTTTTTAPNSIEKMHMSENQKTSAVGIDDMIENILAKLDGEDKMEVISVVGLPGIGKTTLAQNVFDHGLTRGSFQIRAWVTVSQTYSIRRLLIDILRSSSLFEDDDEKSTDDKLGEDLLKRLKDNKYLIVLDDIWSIEAWDGIQRCFPDQDNGSRVLFTSRSITIGKDLSHGDINTQNVSGLSEEHSWSLLKNKVFGDQRRCPPHLEEFGMEIAKKCEGLPLAIVVIGGLLAKKDKTAKAWKQVATSLRPALATNREAYMDTLALSYKHLPLHLKACFLYIGAFPEDYEIPLRSLVWLLVAEGLVIRDQSDDHCTGGVQEGNSLELEEVIIEGYINDLVERSLVMVARKRSCGATKTVRVHDLLRDFCIVQGKEEKFVAHLTYNTHSSYDSIRTEHRCLFVDDRSLNPILCGTSCTPNLRALVHIPDNVDRDSLISTIDFDPDSFRLIKVMALLTYPIKYFYSISKLVHLKYLAVTFDRDVKILPSSITKLESLETLVICTRWKVFHMPEQVWYMVKLRHLVNKGGGVFHFEFDPVFEAKRSIAWSQYFRHPRREDLRRDVVLWNLQTLSPSCVCASCLKLLVRTPNLRKLGLSGNLIPASSGGSTIPDLGFLKKLENLKIVNRKWYAHMSGKLPASIRKLTSLKKLTLQNTLFKWEQISVLGELENLEVLKLVDNACSRSDGHSEWDTSEMEFPKLKYLKMRRLDVVKWDDQNLQFGSLEILVLEQCRRLETIPFELASGDLLHTIEVTKCNSSVEILAMQIVEEHENQYGNNNLRVFIKS